MSSDKEESTSPISPPETARGMTTLDRKRFSRTVKIPGIRIPSRHIGALTKSFKISLLKMQRVKPVADLAKDDPGHKTHKLFLLDPRRFRTADDFTAEDVDRLAEVDVDAKELSWFDLELGYENWNAAEILRAVLPADSSSVSSYSIIGHIAHLNLKPDVMDFKHVIGEVILDKNPSVRTVVNKLNNIDNTFRNFQMELLAGEDNFITRAKENACVFEMDFSKVYWNPRLSTEHQRVVDMLGKGDILYDVFAGVGPFAIPAARKGVTVYANDLNPHSHSALVNNVKLNKVKAGALHTHNLDGREFILKVLKDELASRLLSRAQGRTGGQGKAGSSASLCQGGDQTHTDFPASDCGQFRQLFVTMNLPALALEFLDAYCGLLSDFPQDLRSDPGVLEALPTVLCYCFSKQDDVEADVRERAESVMKHKLPADSRVRHVRNVAPHKEMMCLVFRLTPDILFAGADAAVCCEQNEVEQPPAKKHRVSETQ